MPATIARMPQSSHGLGDCPTCGRTELVLNVGRVHWGICQTHRVRWCIGDNLFSGWLEESESDWARNAATLSHLRVVEPRP